MGVGYSSMSRVVSEESELPPLPRPLYILAAKAWQEPNRIWGEGIGSVIDAFKTAAQPTHNDLWLKLWSLDMDDDAMGLYVDAGVVPLLEETLSFLASRSEPLDYVMVRQLLVRVHARSAMMKSNLRCL